MIVGAGSAGSVLAARLTEDPNTHVLLLEAGGGADKFLIRMPLGMMKAMLKPELTWRMMTEPEPTLNGRRLFLPRGRLLGGSSSINGMVYMRGHSADYDRWAQKGARGWSHAEVLPYFRRMERSWRGTDNYGHDGPLPITKNNTQYLLHDELMQAIANAGQPVTDDIHAGNEEGASFVELTIDEKGRRASTYEAYLKPAMQRPNLAVVTNALTRKVVVENGRATGVEYEVEGEVRIAQATREVILSGGSYNSPQLLMLSGIGPAAHLTELGIPGGPRPPRRRPQPGRAPARPARVRRQWPGHLRQPAPLRPRRARGRAVVPVRHRPVRAPAQQRQPDAAHRSAARAARRPAVLEPGRSSARTCGSPASSRAPSTHSAPT